LKEVLTRAAKIIYRSLYQPSIWLYFSFSLFANYCTFVH
jgi:hypothetical protein